MTVHRIVGPVLRAKGTKFETVNFKRAEERLTELRRIDPEARIVSIPVAR